MTEKGIKISASIIIPICAAILIISLIPLMKGNDYGELSQIRNKARICFINRDIDSALYWSRLLGERSDTVSSTYSYIAAMVYTGQAYMMKGEIDSMRRYFDIAGSLAQRYGDNWAMGTMYNVLGCWSLYNELNKEKTIQYLLDGMRYADKTDDDTLSTTLKCNLALASYILKDPAGTEYSKEVYDIGKRQGNSYMIYCGSVTSAYMHYSIRNHEKALEYIKEAVPYAEMYNDEHGVYTLYGNILLECGEKDKAEECYKIALEKNDVSDKLSGTDIFLSYGEYLISQGEYESAASLLDSGISISYSNRNTINRYMMFRAMAKACSLLNRTEDYGRYMNLYLHERDSLFSLQSVRAISGLKISYERDKFNAQAMAFQHSKRRAWILFTSALIATLAATTIMTSLYLYYRKREKELVAVLEEKRPKFIAQEDTRQSTAADSTQGQEASVTQDITMQDIFRRLEELMRTGHIYRDKDITRDKVAQMLSTNRTYLTNVIQKYTGMNFYAYINTFRIEEAIKILSDKDNDTPIKAIVSDLGFGSMSTFYKFFSAATGYSPSQFRNLSFRE